MKLRRHMPPLKDWHLHFRFPRLRRLPPITQDQALRWAFWLGVAAVAGYLIAALLVFPAPIFPHHQQVPRVLGLPLDEVIARITSVPAGVIRQPDIGTLRPGAWGDATLFAIEDGAFQFRDSRGEARTASRRIAVKRTVRAGQVYRPAAEARA